jgi:hypothetical protein
MSGGLKSKMAQASANGQCGTEVGLAQEYCADGGNDGLAELARRARQPVEKLGQNDTP